MTHPFPWTLEQKGRDDGISPFGMPYYYVQPETQFEVSSWVILDDNGVAIPGFDLLPEEAAKAILKLAKTQRNHVMHEQLLAMAANLSERRAALITMLRAGMIDARQGRNKP